MRRGDIRTALLGALVEGPGHGYEIIGRLEEKSGGVWRPSPGSVYPTLQLFEDEGLVRSEERDGKRIYELTDSGRTEAAERSERYGNAPWEPGAGEESGLHEGIQGMRKAGERLGPALRPLAMAMRQIAASGDASQVEKASAVLQKASKDLYRILAED
jgi:DNA-binding PadR family transcriptional regulator